MGKKLMTRQRLVSDTQFKKFLEIEYGIQNDYVEKMSSEWLYRYMKMWYKCPQILWGPNKRLKKIIENTIEYGVIHECRLIWFIDDKK